MHFNPAKVLLMAIAILFKILSVHCGLLFDKQLSFDKLKLLLNFWDDWIIPQVYFGIWHYIFWIHLLSVQQGSLNEKSEINKYF